MIRFIRSSSLPIFRSSQAENVRKLVYMPAGHAPGQQPASGRPRGRRNDNTSNLENTIIQARQYPHEDRDVSIKKIPLPSPFYKGERRILCLLFTSIWPLIL